MRRNEPYLLARLSRRRWLDPRNRRLAAQQCADTLFERRNELAQDLPLVGCRAFEAGQVGDASPHAAGRIRGQINKAGEDRDAGGQ